MKYFLIFVLIDLFLFLKNFKKKKKIDLFILVSTFDHHISCINIRKLFVYPLMSTKDLAKKLN